MEGADGKPFGAEEEGPFLISSKGQFRTLSGEPMPWPRAPRGRGRRRARLPGLRDLGGRSGTAFGARLTAVWTPERDVGLPTAGDSGFTAMGVELSHDASLGEEGVAMGAGGAGSTEDVLQGDGSMPIGARASVPARIGVDFERVGRSVDLPSEPYGMKPLELTEEQVYGSGASPFGGVGGMGALGAGEDLRLIEPYQQFVPPPPASQDVCIVNGFDPRWGQPPRTWRGVVMRFDPGLGAYGFDPESPRIREAFERTESPRLMEWFEEVGNRYRSGHMLQPYKPGDGSGQWTFRWIPRRQEVVCV